MEKEEASVFHLPVKGKNRASLSFLTESLEPDLGKWQRATESVGLEHFASLLSCHFLLSITSHLCLLSVLV